MEDQSLALAFGNSLTEEVSDLAGEYAELTLDSLVEDSLFKDIPLVSTFTAVYRIGKSISERYHIAKLIAFLNEINKGIVDEEKRQNYREKFASNEKFRNRELEYILILIDRYISFDKPQMLAKLYLAYLDGAIVWDEFMKYAEVIDRFLPGDFAELKKKNQIGLDDLKVPDSLNRLISLGFITKVMPIMQAPTTLGSIRIEPPTNNDYIVSRFGKKFLAIMEEHL